MLRSLFVAALLAAACAAASAATGPSRATTAPARVTALDLSGATVAYATAATPRDCFHVELWRPRERRSWRLGPKRPCGDEPSTGFGISGVAVSRSRAAWVTYAGGNSRDWELWTATTTRRAPRNLRLVPRPVEDPAPVLVGPGTPAFVPYAVDEELTLLADDGSVLLRTMLAAPVRALAGGVAPGRIRVAVLLADRTLRLVRLDGTMATAAGVSYDPRAVLALRLGRAGAAVQVGRRLELVGPAGRTATRLLPPGATMVDLTATAVLVERAGGLLLVPLAPGPARRIVDGTPDRPVLGRLDGTGLAWSRGARVVWRPHAI